MQVDNILNLQGFKLLEILNQQPENKTMFMHGTFDGEDKSAIVIIERLHFPAEPEIIESGVKNSKDLVKKEANDIYGFYEARLPENFNGVKLTLVYPATDKHLQKYRRKKYHLIKETCDHYRNITLSYLEESKFSIQWVYNILSHTKEADRIVFEDPNPETGFILLPDAKWDGVTVDSLYLIAIVHKRGIKSLRDLTPDHLPLLENIQKKSKEAVAKKYNIAVSKIRIYFHYQPSYYHLHAHVTFLQYSPPVAMSRLGFTVTELRLSYLTYVRPILEYCCPVWGPQVQNTVYLSEELESVQKRATKIIMGPSYQSYEHALSELRIPSLFDQRHELMLNFGVKPLASDKYRDPLPPDAPKNSRTRQQNRLEPVSQRTYL